MPRRPISDSLIAVYRAAFGTPLNLDAFSDHARALIESWNHVVVTTAFGASAVWERYQDLPPDVPDTLVRAARAELAAHPDAARVVTHVHAVEEPDTGMFQVNVVSADPLAHEHTLRCDPHYVMHELLPNPMLTATEAKAALDRLHRASARKALREVLTSPFAAASDHVHDNARLVARLLGGVGRQAGPLRRLLDDPDAHPHAAAIARTLLLEHAPEALVDLLTPEELADNALSHLVDMLETEASAETLAGVLAELPAEMLAEMLPALDDARRDRGLPSSVWTPVLDHPDGTTFADLLRPRLKAADLPTRDVQGFVGAPDGQGAWQAFLVETARDGTYALIGVVVRETEGLRDGLFVTGLSASEADRWLDDLRHVSPVVPVDVATAATWIRDVVERHPSATKPLDAATHRAYERFRTHASRRASVPPPPTPGPSSDEATWRHRLATWPSMRAWFLDHADARVLGIAPEPDGSMPDASVFASAIARSDVVRRRVAGMLTAHARWMAIQGTADAGSFEAAARSLAPGATPDAFLAAFAAHCRDTLDGLTAADPFQELGSPRVRTDLKRTLRPARPRMSDLATLDLAEAFGVHDWALAAQVPGWASIPAPARERALLAAARAVVPALLDVVHGRDGDARTIEHALATGLRDALDDACPDEMPTELRRIAARMMEAYCQTCPVGCWQHPRRGARRAWEADEHPALGR